MTNLPQSVLDAIAQAAKEGRVTGLGVGPLPGQHAGPTPGGVAATPPESEAAFQQRVIALAQSCRWMVAHFRPARCVRRDGTVYYETPVQADGAGFPDLVLVRDRVLFVELKTDKGVVRPNQRFWIEALRATGATALVWRPRDWAEIDETLR